MGHGGYRNGAGRKKGFAAKNTEEARKFISARLAEEIGPICDALMHKAKKGDIRAIKELFDRAWGRPTMSDKEVLKPRRFIILDEVGENLEEMRNTISSQLETFRQTPSVLGVPMMNSD